MSIITIIPLTIGAAVGFALAWFIATRKNAQMLANIARLEAQKDAQDKAIERQKQDRADDEARFENLANKIFEEKTKSFQTSSKHHISELLTPIKGDIERFNKKVEDAFSQHSKEQFSLKNEIEKITQINSTLGTQADNLTKALKGDSKAQGDWGEVILENLLRDSGLQEGRDYVLQGKDLKLKDERGRHQKPDVIVNLPDGKQIIIDSKVSLKDYETYCSDNTNEDALKSFLASVRRHIKELSAAGYQNLEGLHGAPDFVMMFIPIEGAYSLAIQKDAGLYSYARDLNVALVCSSVLFVTLLTIESLWKLENQNKNTIEIARVGGALHDKITGFVENMELLGRQLNTAGRTYEDSFKQLSSGKGNIIGTAKKLHDLGAKHKKQTPQISIDSSETER